MDTNEQEVKHSQVIELKPTETTDDDEIIEPITKENETPTSSSDDENESVVEETTTEPQTVEKEPNPVLGETPREKALRLEVARVKGLLRKEKSEELFVPQKHIETANPISSKYDPEQLKEFDELFETLAKQKGLIRKDELQSQTFQERADDQFNSFMEGHPEYADATLWEQFKNEFNLYKTPSNPKDLGKLFNKVHESIFGTSSANINKINAQQEKIKTASHTGSIAGRISNKTIQAPNTNVRKDMLKGFSDDEIKEIYG